MTAVKTKFSNKQLLFKEMVLGTLIYSVVLGFFDDYTNVFSAKSFSTVFLAGVVMQVLTYLTFMLKDVVVNRYKTKVEPGSKFGMYFGIWLIMFLSKFVFLWVIDMVFGSNITISGFIGLIAIIVSVTVLNKLADYTFKRLSN